MGLGLLAVGAALSAAQAPAGERRPEAEIVVVGERASRRLRDTASSVVVFTQDRIEGEAGADRVETLFEAIPNVQLGTGGQGPAIRGQDTTGVLQDLPAFLGGNRPRATIQVDGRAVSYNEFVFGAAPLWDVAQVELFRSPQVTTQGRNSIAGAIFVTTNDPSSIWQARGRIARSSFATWHGSAMVTGPLVGDQLAFRLAGDWRAGRPASKMTGNHVGAEPDRESYRTLRAKLLAQPAALPGLRLEAVLAHTGSRMPQIDGIRAPFRERRDPLATYGIFDTNVDSLTAEARLAASPSLDLAATLTGGDARVRRFAPAGLGETRIHSRDQSVELLADWRPRSELRARFGVHYLGTRLDQSINLSAVFGMGEFLDLQQSLGLFGEADLALAERLRLTAGVRFQRDRQQRDGTLGTLADVDFDRTFEAWLPKLVLTYLVSDAVSAGAMVQHASQPGGVTINFDTQRMQAFDMETMWSFEAFARASLYGDRLSLSANLFRNDFRDAQRGQSRIFRVPTGGFASWLLIENVPEARSHGLEASLDWRATERLRMRAAAGLLRTRIAKNSGGVFAGKEFGRAPKFSASASAEWRPVERLRLNAAVRHRSAYFSNDLNTPNLRVEQATMVDARAAFELGRFTLSAYARNLTDRLAMTYLFNPVFGTAADPRELGVILDSRF